MGYYDNIGAAVSSSADEVDRLIKALLSDGARSKAPTAIKSALGDFCGKWVDYRDNNPDPDKASSLDWKTKALEWRKTIELSGYDKSSKGLPVWMKAAVFGGAVIGGYYVVTRSLGHLPSRESDHDSD